MTWPKKHTSLLTCTVFWACLLVASGGGTAHAQTEISEIVENPDQYSNQVVRVEGTIDRHVSTGNGGDATSSTENYVLRGDTGAEIRIKTANEPPAVGARRQVEGLVSISPFNREPVMIEQNRTAPSDAEEEPSGAQLQQGFSTTAVYLIFGLGVLIVGALAYFAYASGRNQRQRRPMAPPRPQPSAPEELEPKEGATEPAPSTSTETTTEELQADASGPDRRRIKSESSSSLEPEDDSSTGPETLMFKAPPKTMKFVPGRLVIAAGPDQGKEFRIAGHPTPNGNVVTIGRAKVEGDRAFAHIQLGDTYRTVSRMQAELIQQDQTILLKNKSETNPTMVNGEQVPSDQLVEISDGDMIRMGELMLRYERD